jgi:tetratricopeptide (TPR) repeat protein
MHIALILLLVLMLTGWYICKAKKERSIRQCSYGNLKSYDVLKKSSNYQPLKKLLSEAKTFEERYFYSVSISREFPLEILERWTNEEPDSADALLCYGARLVQWSWDARGYGRGFQVSEKKWDRFFERLAKTESVLMKCAEEMPSDPTPWAYMIIVSTWNSEDHDIRFSYLEQAVSRDPYNWAAHMHMIIALSEKWGGDNEEMIAFAEKVAKSAPAGSDLPTILIKAYLEYWKYLNIFQDKPDEADKFLRSSDIQENAVKAYLRSLASEDFQETAVSIFARYNISAWFWLIRDRERLKNNLDILGNDVDDIHWRWAGTEGELKEARDFPIMVNKAKYNPAMKCVYWMVYISRSGVCLSIDKQY